MRLDDDEKHKHEQEEEAPEGFLDKLGDTSMLSRRTFVTASAATAVVPSAPSMVKAQSDTVIVVSESKAVRAFATRALERKGYSFLEANNLWDGLRLLSSSGAEALVTYEETSPEVWRRIRPTFPTARFFTVRDAAPKICIDV